jgi:hypothetical protein
VPLVQAVRVERERELLDEDAVARLGRAQVGLGVLPLDHATELAADARENVQERLVGLEQLGREELEHCRNLAVDDYREGEAAVDPVLGRPVRAGVSTLLRRRTREPVRAPVGQDQAGEPAAFRLAGLVGRRAEGREGTG